MPDTKLLVVEDEEAFVEALEVSLAAEGFDVTVARDGVEALEVFEQSRFDLVLLDVMLPRMSGVDVCREIRATSKVPVIMVTARTSEIDVVVGLEVGADDYVSKPYRMRELVARIRAVLRRRGESDSTSVAPTGGPVVVGDVSLDPDRHEVVVRGSKVKLPLKEFELLHLLLRNVGLVLGRDVLIERVWGADFVGETKTLDVHIKRLRSRVETDPSKPTRIVTVRGVGYKYEAPRG